MRGAFHGEAVLAWLCSTGDGVVLSLHLPPDQDTKDLLRMVNGQRLRLSVKAIAEDSLPEDIAPHTRARAGETTKPLARLAGMWCRDPKFIQWLSGTFPSRWKAHATGQEHERAAAVVRSVCGVTSRAHLDGNGKAAALFHEHLRRPFTDWVTRNTSQKAGT